MKKEEEFKLILEKRSMVKEFSHYLNQIFLIMGLHREMIILNNKEETVNTVIVKAEHNQTYLSHPLRKFQ